MHKSCQDSKRMRWSYCNCNCLSWVYPVTSQSSNKIEQSVTQLLFDKSSANILHNIKALVRRMRKVHSDAAVPQHSSLRVSYPIFREDECQRSANLLHTNISPMSSSSPCPSAQRYLSVKALLQKQLRAPLGSSVFLKVYHSFHIFINNSWFIHNSW